MKPNQDRFVSYSPITGVQTVKGYITAMFLRSEFPDREWLFNPWTGKMRAAQELKDDPRGWWIDPDISPVKNTDPTGDNIQVMLDERGKRYGKFTTHAELTQALKRILMQHVYTSTSKFEADQLEALDMICHKLGRIVNGDPNYADSWDDIAGYAKLVGDRLRGVVR